MFEDIAMMQDLTDQERLMFQAEMSTRRKDPTMGLVLCLFLGGLGAHRFYLGETMLGILYLVFCWTFVPLVISIIELFLIKDRIRAYNTQAALEVATKLKVLRAGF